jgi:hypothetical protein
MRKRKKKRFDTLFDSFLHPLSLFGHLINVRLTIVLARLLCPVGQASSLSLLRWVAIQKTDRLEACPT